MATRGYDRDEYEDLDEYEEDGDDLDEEGEGGEEYEEEEEAPPTQEQLEYLELREKLKERYRKQMKKESGTASHGSRDQIKSTRKDNFGSFFGPSKPVIAQRVIQESKSLLENPNLAAKLSKSSHPSNKSNGSSTGGSKPRTNNPPKVLNGLKAKVEILKNTRDYSFLNSDDAEVPAPSKNQASIKNPLARNASVPKSETQSGDVSHRRKQPPSNTRREDPSGREARKPMPANGHSRPKVGPEKPALPNKSLIDSRKHLSSNDRNGTVRPEGQRGLPSKISTGGTGKKVTAPVAKSSIPNGHRPSSSTSQSSVRKPVPSHLQSGLRKPITSNMHRSESNKMVAQRKEYQEMSKGNGISRPSSSSSHRAQVKQPPTKTSARPSIDDRSKRKPSRPYDEDSDDGQAAINEIRKMFRYNPNNYRDVDDDSDMEAGFDDILREERLSAKIARKEDEEQARLIEEEERRERMRLAKKRKMSQQ